MSNVFYLSHGGCFTEMESSVVWAVYLQMLMPGAVTSKHINPRSWCRPWLTVTKQV